MAAQAAAGLPSDLPLPPAPPSPSVLPGAPGLRVHGQGEGPRVCCRRRRPPKWPSSAFPGLLARPSTPHPPRPLLDTLGEGARRWGKSLRFVNRSRDCGGGGGGGWEESEVAFPWRSGVSDEPGRVTPSRLYTLSQELRRRRGQGYLPPLPTLSGVLVRSDFFFPPQYYQCTAPNGFRFVFTTPPTPNESLVRSILPSPSSLLPTLPSSPSKTRSLRLDILQASYTVFRIVTFFTPPHPISTLVAVYFCPSPA